MYIIAVTHSLGCIMVLYTASTESFSLSLSLSCFLSFQLCRLAYELMQNHHVDASGKFYSLDNHYYFGGKIQRKDRVLMDQAGTGYN